MSGLERGRSAPLPHRNFKKQFTGVISVSV